MQKFPLKPVMTIELQVGFIQTIGTRKEPITAPTTPVNNKVNKVTVGSYVVYV